MLETAPEMDPRKKAAVAFINVIRTMDPRALNALIIREAGEELAEFFLSYSANLIQKDPDRILENCTSLMLMGFLMGRGALHLERPPPAEVVLDVLPKAQA